MLPPLAPLPAHLSQKPIPALPALASVQNTVVVGQPVTVIVSVETSAPGSGIPGGTVLISNGNDECTVTLDEKWRWQL